MKITLSRKSVMRRLSAAGLVTLWIGIGGAATAGAPASGPDTLGKADYDLRATQWIIADLLSGKAIGKTIILQVEIDKERTGHRFINCFPTTHTVKGENSQIYAGLSCTDVDGDAFYVPFYDEWQHLTGDTKAREIWFKGRIVSNIAIVNIPIIETEQVLMVPSSNKPQPSK